MGLFSSPSAVATPDADTAPRRTKFRVLLLLGIILLSLQFASTVSALDFPTPTAPTNGDVMRTNNSHRSVVNSSRESELRATSSSNQTVDVEALFHLRHKHQGRFQASNFVRTSLLRKQEQHHQQQQNDTKDMANLRKLSSQFGCLADATVCLTVPGWTPATQASTCCGNGFCTDIAFDELHCGACGRPCNFGYFCCSGVCVETAIDPENCGRCANVCPGGTCEFGFCGYTSFNLGIKSKDSA